MIDVKELRIGNYISAKGGRSFEAKLLHLNKLGKKNVNFTQFLLMKNGC
jgi:hypothetical protein